jgi:hypothetical protein
MFWHDPRALPEVVFAGGWVGSPERCQDVFAPFNQILTVWFTVRPNPKLIDLDDDLRNELLRHGCQRTACKHGNQSQSESLARWQPDPVKRVVSGNRDNLIHSRVTVADSHFDRHWFEILMN